MQQHDPPTAPTDLMECLDLNHEHPSHPTFEIGRTDYYKKTYLHRAIENGSVDVVQLLLEKGIDVNAQEYLGNTALHLSCSNNYDFHGQAQTELVSMLLYHGADPWIRNTCGSTPFDWILTYRCSSVTTIEHLYYYMFDQYTEFGLSAYTLLRAAYLELPIFQEIVGTIKEVELDKFVTIPDLYINRHIVTTPSKNLYIELILTMPTENLRILLDKFDYVLIDIFLSSHFNAHYQIRHENVYILAGSHLQREFIDCLCNELSYGFLYSLFTNPAPLASREKILYYLLSCGMEINKRDIETVYEYCGYNDLFKFLRFMDVKSDVGYLNQLMPRLVFQVTGDIQKSIEEPQFWVKHVTNKYGEYSPLDFKPVLAYYAVANLKDLCCDCEVEVEGKENFLKKLHDQPRIPLLVEMARNVFRKHFVKRLRIMNANQFYMSLELLPISPHHRKIIALETELY